MSKPRDGSGRRPPRQPGPQPSAGAGGAGQRPQRGRSRAPTSDARERNGGQQSYDGPPIDDDVTGAELATPVRRQLSSLPDRLAERVARHLVMAGRLLYDDPQTAYQHTQAARARAGRLAVVREASGEAAYVAGHFSEALSDLRAARRMNGSAAYLPMMADCERALGRPDRALVLARDEAVSGLDESGQVEMTIVAAGARRDAGDAAAAVALLEAAPVHSRSRAPWVARLRYAYADALLEAGRSEDALEWFHRTVDADSQSATDAVDRVAALTSGAG